LQIADCRLQIAKYQIAKYQIAKYQIANLKVNRRESQIGDPVTIKMEFEIWNLRFGI